MLKNEFYSYKNDISKICKSEGIKKLMLFGSTLNNESTNESDIDLLVTFQNKISMFKIIGVKHKLEDLLHTDVDLLTEKSLSPYFKEKVLQEAEVIYEA